MPLNLFDSPHHDSTGLELDLSGLDGGTAAHHKTLTLLTVALAPTVAQGLSQPKVDAVWRCRADSAVLVIAEVKSLTGHIRPSRSGWGLGRFSITPSHFEPIRRTAWRRSGPYWPWRRNRTIPRNGSRLRRLAESCSLGHPPSPGCRAKSAARPAPRALGSPSESPGGSARVGLDICVALVSPGIPRHLSRGATSSHPATFRRSPSSPHPPSGHRRTSPASTGQNPSR